MINIYYNRNYIAFNLYINSLTNILKNNIEYKVITNIKEATDFDFLILFVNDATEVMHITDKKIIFIVADNFIYHSNDFKEKFTHYVKNINPDNIYAWEYNILNIEYYKQHFPNIKTHFIPLMYNKYLEDVYKVQRINYKDKPIDVLFMGCLSDRRVELLKKIQRKYKFYFMTEVNDMKKYMNVIENSKIIIHIFSNENNRTFDYYRFSLLLSNKVMILTEDYNSDINFECLSEMNKHMIQSKYDTFIEKIDEVLNKSSEEISEIVEKSYTEYKKHGMENHVLDFFRTTF
jgi:hypothetical protein